MNTPLSAVDVGCATSGAFMNSSLAITNIGDKTQPYRILQMRRCLQNLLSEPLTACGEVRSI
jgi:hypothetical protein